MPGAALGRSLVVQELGKQNALPAVLTFDEALHLQLRSSVVEILAQPAFSRSLRGKADMTRTGCHFRV